MTTPTDSESLKNELWDVFEYNFGKDRREGRDIETMDEVMSLIEAEITKRESKAYNEALQMEISTRPKTIEEAEQALLDELMEAVAPNSDGVTREDLEGRSNFVTRKLYDFIASKRPKKPHMFRGISKEIDDIIDEVERPTNNKGEKE